MHRKYDIRQMFVLSFFIHQTFEHNYYIATAVYCSYEQCLELVEAPRYLRMPPKSMWNASQLYNYFLQDNYATIIDNQYDIGGISAELQFKILWSTLSRI